MNANAAASGHDTRGAIVDAAMVLLAKQGPRGKWKVLDVCKHAGISRATFYVYFEGREHLLAECLRGIMRDCTRAVSELKSTNIYESMLEFGALLRPGSGSLDAGRKWGLLEILDVVQSSSDLKDEYVQLIVELRESLVERVKTCQAEGTMDPALDPEGVAGILNAVLFTGVLFSQLGVPLRPNSVFGALASTLSPKAPHSEVRDLAAAAAPSRTNR